MAYKMSVASIPSTLLREPQRFLDELSTGVKLQEKALALTAFCVLFFGVYGSVLGSSSGVIQAAVSAIKLPMLFLLTMAICFPTLHILNLLFGAKHSTVQLAVLLLAALAATGTILVGFLPISLFFLMTNDSYAFYKLLNVAILAIAAFYGVRFLGHGMSRIHEGLDTKTAPNRSSVLTLWIVLYAFVGSQLAWVTRPYFGEPDMQWQVFRTQRGNFFVDIMQAVKEIAGPD
ncbi:MAG: actin-binding WH2 domain-containing protein [Fimbriimonadales bacterium]